MTIYYSNDYINRMSSQLKPEIRVINFRKLQPLQQGCCRRVSMDSALLTVVLAQIGGTQGERSKMKQCEHWLKKNELIRLMKITSMEAFQPTYRLMMKQSLPVYFILLVPIELTPQPICSLYRHKLTPAKGLLQIDAIAEDNISRIKFIIIQDQLEQLSKMSFLHSGIHLVTTQTTFVFDAIEQQLRTRGSLKAEQSSSSVNTQQIDTFAKQMDQKIGEGVLLPLKKTQLTFDSVRQAWMMKNNTPGVGSYNLSK